MYVINKDCMIKFNDKVFYMQIKRIQRKAATELTFGLNDKNLIQHMTIPLKRHPSIEYNVSLIDFDMNNKHLICYFYTYSSMIPRIYNEQNLGLNVKPVTNYNTMKKALIM